MRNIDELALEKIGDDLCLVFKTDGSAFRGVLGRINPAKLEEVADGFSEAMSAYYAQPDGAFNFQILKR